MEEKNNMNNKFLNTPKIPIKRSISSNKMSLSQILLNTKNFLINNTKKTTMERNIKQLQSLKNLNNNISHKDTPFIINSPQSKYKKSNFVNYLNNASNSKSNKNLLKNLMSNSKSFDNYQKLIIDSKIHNSGKNFLPLITKEEKKDEVKKLDLKLYELNSLTCSSRNIFYNSIINSKNFYFSFKTISTINNKTNKYAKLKEKNNQKIYNLSTNEILRDIILNEYNYEDLNKENPKNLRNFRYYNKWIIEKILELKKEIPPDENLHKKFEKEYKNSKYNKPLLNLNSLSVSFNSKGKYHLFHVPFELLPLFYYKNMSYLKHILISIIKFDNDFEDIYIDYNEIEFILSYSKQFRIKDEDVLNRKDIKNEQGKKNKKFNFTSLLNISKLSSKKMNSKKFNNNMKGFLEYPVSTKNGAFSPKEAFKLKNKLNFIEKHEIQIINHNSNDHANQDSIEIQKNKTNKNEFLKIETNLYKCKYNKFIFKWNTPKRNYDITIKAPEAIFQFGRIIIKTYIDIELIFYLIENNFKNWDFYISQYIFSFKDFKKNMGKLISVKSSAELFPKGLDSFPSLKYTLSTKDMKEVFKKNKISYLNEEKIHQISEKSKKYEFIFTDKNNFNYIKVFHNFLIIAKCNSFIKNKFYFDFNFFHMKILNNILKIQGLNYFFKKLIYFDKETLSLKFRYNELSSLNNDEYKLLENIEPNINAEKENLRMKEREKIINFTIIFPTLETILYNNKDYNDCFESDYNNVIYSGISLNILDELCKNNYNEWSNILLKK